MTKTLFTSYNCKLNNLCSSWEYTSVSSIYCYGGSYAFCKAHFPRPLFGTKFRNNMCSHLKLWIPELLLNLLKCFLSFSNSELTTYWHLYTWNSLEYKRVFLLLF